MLFGEMPRKCSAQNNHSRHTAIIINEKAVSSVKEIISTEAHLSGTELLEVTKPSC